MSPLEALVASVEALDDPDAKARARALVAGVLELHREGLEAIVDVLGEQHPEVLGSLCEAPAAAALLLLHDLHPRSPVERAGAALEGVEAELRGLGARVSDLSYGDGVLRVRVTRDDPSRHGRAARQVIEAALVEATPDAQVLIEGTRDVTLVQLGGSK